jgi:cytochrome c oxidase assembly factor CtaG
VGLRRGCALTGALAAAIALSPPVEDRVTNSLTAHMVQHLALVTVAAPLLGVGLPIAFAPRRWLHWAIASAAVTTTALWLWHAPALFDAAADNVALHMAEHVSFLASATLLWSVVAGPGRRAQSGAGLFAVFAAGLPAMFLGVALTLSNHAWYTAYPSLSDQRVAGALMWAAGSGPGLLAAALLFASWLSTASLDRPAAPRRSP